MIESLLKKKKVLATFYEEEISFWVLGQDLDGLLSHVLDVGFSGFFIVRVVTIYIVLHVAGFEQTCQFHVILYSLNLWVFLSQNAIDLKCF